MAHPTILKAHKPTLGFVDLPTIRMEEEAGDSLGAAKGAAEVIPAMLKEVIWRLTEHRSEILRLIENQKLSVRDGTRLLEENDQLITRLRGGYSFGTEKVIYSILGFSAVVIFVLSWMTAYHNLKPEVTITFVGTVVGGTIATIAQKLGKVGR